MALKINFSRLDQLSRDELTALKALNENYTKLEKLLDTLLSRDGLYPNQMQADLDMNHKRILNVESGPGDNDVVTRKDIKELIAKTEQAIKDFNTLYEQALKGLDLYNKELIQPDIEELNVKIEQFYNTIDNLVDKTTDQEIGGIKRLTSGVFQIQNKDMQFNVAPSSRQESRIVFNDKNAIAINNITCNRYPNGSTFMEFHTHAQNGAWSQPNTCFRVGHDGSKFVAEVPTPNANSNGRDVATTAWVVSKLGDIESTLDAINGEIV